MGRNVELHRRLLALVLLLLAAPIALFVLCMRLELNAQYSFLGCLGLFIYIMVYISICTTRAYASKSRKKIKLG